ncbi:MAG: tRNA(Ile)(2)-agmatinylcytidine synthase, partial [Desulfurococcales archaeon]|nr:tRNA(Ile)(2)-agmatinylcytidine synthase [Desulfurococcales archaeon]
MAVLSISFDDVDSRFWGCTTHLAGLFLAEQSRRPRVRPADYPLLVRLNPAVPWKTRGNAAVVARLLIPDGLDWRDLCEAARALVDEYTRPRIGDPVKRPGVACALGEPWGDPRLRWLYRKALTDLVTTDVAGRVSAKAGVATFGGRGVVGATAALAALAPGDPYTFELTAYRHPDRWGQPRCILHDRAAAVESSTPPCTLNNYDPLSRRLTAAPGGPDPVLAGFRGTCPRHLARYSAALCEEPHFWVLYRSNQHTDPHAAPLLPPRPYKSGTLRGRVYSEPETIPGGHVAVIVESSGWLVDALFFRETGPLNRAARLLGPGDTVTLHGSVRPYAPRGRPVLAVDKMVVHTVTPRFTLASPRCPRCGARMKSLGRSGGYKCP